MQRRNRPRPLTAVVAVLVVLTVVNLGVSATWWTRAGATTHGASASGVSGSATSGPSVASASTPPVGPDHGSATPAPTSDLGIPAAEAPGRNPPPVTEDLARTWTAPATLPSDGRLLRVQIPATVSHFTARPALVWLPPAALTPDPPHLPVAVLLSGQSRGAGPDDVEDSGHIAATADALARTDRGLAPIIVVPDQLGPASANPMCVDGPLGNSRTYLEQDVPRWVTSHLLVQSGASAWTIGGFSQGGTCAIQLGAGDPERFGNLIDVSGQDAPSLGSLTATIDQGFSGDGAAYHAAVPATELAAHAPYRSSDAFFAAGQDDHVYGPVMPVMAARARAVGMHVTTWVVPGGGHNWTTAGAGLAAGLASLVQRTGLAPS
jgi:enterochelin esterase-like enzyme